MCASIAVNNRATSTKISADRGPFIAAARGILAIRGQRRGRLREVDPALPQLLCGHVLGQLDQVARAEQGKQFLVAQELETLQ